MGATLAANPNQLPPGRALPSEPVIIRGSLLDADPGSRAAGHGGIAAVSRVTRIAASTIGRGLKELDAPPPPTPNRIRRPGGDASR